MRRGRNGKKASPKPQPKRRSNRQKTKNNQSDKSPDSKKQKTSSSKDQSGVHLVSPSTTAHTPDTLSDTRSLEGSSRMNEDSSQNSPPDPPAVIRVVPPLPDSPPPPSPTSPSRTSVKQRIQYFESPPTDSTKDTNASPPPSNNSDLSDGSSESFLPSTGKPLPVILEASGEDPSSSTPTSKASKDIPRPSTKPILKTTDIPVKNIVNLTATTPDTK